MTKSEFRREQKITIDRYKEDTNFFNGTMTELEMHGLLRYRMQFSEAESRVIIASLYLAGAKFKQ